MTKKFTEEQYQEIINIWNNGQDFDDTILSVSDYARKLNARLNYEYGDNIYGYSEAILLSFPNSREWAHDKFVEKEKRYVWYLKNNKRYRLTNHAGTSPVNLSHSISELTESEIKEWGYNSEMFDREEVED